jgi:hypothetical protein
MYLIATKNLSNHSMKNIPGIRKVWLSLSFVLGIAVLVSAQTASKASSPGKTAGKSSALVGAWQGTFNGSASGQCELRFSRDGNGNLAGQVSIHPEGGEQSPFIPFESIAVEGSRLKATFTDGQGDKVQMDGTLENDALKGSWKTSAGQEGNWQSTKAGME